MKVNHLSFNKPLMIKVYIYVYIFFHVILLFRPYILSVVIPNNYFGISLNYRFYEYTYSGIRMPIVYIFSDRKNSVNLFMEAVAK